MQRQVPSNTTQTITDTVERSKLLSVLEKLNECPNVVSVEYEPIDNRVKVTVHYAIMDLAVQLGVVAAFVETTFKDARYGR